MDAGVATGLDALPTVAGDAGLGPARDEGLTQTGRPKAAP